METGSYCDSKGFHFIPVKAVADWMGFDEPGIRFVMGMLAGYPFALGFHLIVPKANSTAKHLYIISCGLLLSYFCFGSHAVHSLISILVTYGILRVWGGSITCVIVTFLFHMTYLFTGYYICSCESYSIDVTLPQAVLCLKFIGLAWDLYDGSQKRESLSKDQQETSLDKVPSLLEISAFIYFYGTYLAGPQFSMKRYLDFAENRLIDEKAEKIGPSRYAAGFKKLILGFCFVALNAWLQGYYPLNYVISRDYLEQPFWKRIISLNIWSQSLYSKYFVVWLFAEGCTIMTGLSYSGKTVAGGAEWNAVRNLDVVLYFTGDSLKSLLHSFNIGTNIWISKYIFKRLRFLGSKALSHLLTVIFVAAWHGTYIGYYMCFLTHFIYGVAFEEFQSLFPKTTGKSNEEISWIFKLPSTVFYVFLKFYVFAFSLVPLGLLTWEKSLTAWKSQYFVPLITSFAIVILTKVVQMVRSGSKAIEHGDEKRTMKKME